MPRKPKLDPRSYAARVARGKRPISIELPEPVIARLDAHAGIRGESRAETIQAALELFFDRSDTG